MLDNSSRPNNSCFPFKFVTRRLWVLCLCFGFLWPRRILGSLIHLECNTPLMCCAARTKHPVVVGNRARGRWRARIARTQRSSLHVGIESPDHIPAAECCAVQIRTLVEVDLGFQISQVLVCLALSRKAFFQLCFDRIIALVGFV